MALKKPDGKYAEIAYFGFLDLEFNSKNEEGNDIAIYARRTKVGILPETMNYGVFVKTEKGEWNLISEI